MNCDGTLRRVRRRHQEAARLADRRSIVTYTNCSFAESYNTRIAPAFCPHAYQGRPERSEE
jgi:hypothetical protein